MTLGRRWLVAGLVVASVAATAGCGQDQVATYCETVSDRQAALSETVAAGDKTALIEALPDFRALAADAPDDIEPSWRTVIDAIEGLEEAVASERLQVSSVSDSSAGS